MNIKTNKSLEQLENDYWSDTELDTALVRRCNQLRKKPIKDFEIEDLRIMIGQGIGLDFLVPVAIERLKDNILAEGDFYEGDLLTSILKSDKNYWIKKIKDWEMICDLFQKNMNELKSVDISEDIRNQWFIEFDRFKRIIKNAR